MSFEIRNRLREDYDSLMDLYRRISLFHKTELTGTLVKDMCSDERVDVFKHILSKVSDNKFGSNIRSINIDEESIPFISSIEFINYTQHILCKEDINSIKRIIIRNGNIRIDEDGLYEIKNIIFDKELFPSNYWEWTDEHHVYFKMAFL